MAPSFRPSRLDAVLRDLMLDIEFRHRHEWPARPFSFLSRLQLLAVSPGLWALAMHRLAFRCRGNSIAGLLLAPLKWLVMARTKCDIGSNVHIDPGVIFSDHGHIVYGASRTGSGTVIGTRVTVGRRLTDVAHPTLGNDVHIGDDCVVYGPIHVGDGARLLPGTVLTKSLPPGAVVQGNPARVLRAGGSAPARP